MEGQATVRQGARLSRCALPFSHQAGSENMAWGGKHSRMTEKQRKHFFRTSNRSLPRPEPPQGIPTEIMRTLAQENLSSDPAAFNRRLQELLTAYKLSDGR